MITLINHSFNYLSPLNVFISWIPTSCDFFCFISMLFYTFEMIIINKTAWISTLMSLHTFVHDAPPSPVPITSCLFPFISARQQAALNSSTYLFYKTIPNQATPIISTAPRLVLITIRVSKSCFHSASPFCSSVPAPSGSINWQRVHRDTGF